MASLVPLLDPPLINAFLSYGLNNCVLQMQEDNFSIEVVIGFFKEAYPKDMSKAVQEFKGDKISFSVL